MDNTKWHNDGLDAQRDRIATAAMAAILTATGSDWRYMDSYDVEGVAKSAIKHANALIKELNRGR